MDITIEDSKLGSSPFRSLDEQETAESLNNACLLNDSDLPFDDRGGSHDVSAILIPETPSPFSFRGKRNSEIADYHRGSTHCTPDTRKTEPGDKIPGYLHTTPSSQRTLKRRRLQQACSNTPNVNGVGVGFVPASSLLPSDLTWLESPRPPPYTSSSCSVPVASTSAGAPRHTVLVAPTTRNCSSETPPCGRTSLQRTLGISRKEQKSKRTSTRTSAVSSACAAAVPFLGAEQERCLQDAETEKRNGAVNTPACQIHEEIIIVDEDEDDAVVVEAMVRSIQMAEDEAFARSLQEQFDREEQLQQDQRRLEATASHSQPQNHQFDSYVGLGWISPWASMVNSASFSHRSTEFEELQQVMFQGQPSIQRRAPQSNRSRNTRLRHTRNLPLDLLDDSQGNNYEALLQFEENQGAVVTKNTLSKREIERLPTKTYDPARNAGKTDCQICFSSYKEREKLRILPCLHDYHVKCIDRWLKENATCPICRADVSVCT